MKKNNTQINEEIDYSKKYEKIFDELKIKPKEDTLTYDNLNKENQWIVTDSNSTFKTTIDYV